MPAGRRTIFALSSGAPPAGIAVVRISGQDASAALVALAGALPTPRMATLRWLRSTDGEAQRLDQALVLWFPGPGSATGEDLAELHLHGGKAVVAAVLTELAGLPGLRVAEPGEFTRRSFENGRIDLAEAEGLADLLLAETEAQRRNALEMSAGGLTRLIAGWEQRLLALSAAVEAMLDFSDEDDVANTAGADFATLQATSVGLAADIAVVLERPLAERLRDGIRVILAGPPNAGKSTLFNALVGRDAAITSAIAGTTRDLIEAPVEIGGVAYVFVDTAGVRDDSTDAIECIGIGRSRAALASADIILWLGNVADLPSADRIRAIPVAAKSDIAMSVAEDPEAMSVSALTGTGIDLLIDSVRRRAAKLLPAPNELALKQRQRDMLDVAAQHLHDFTDESDLVLAAEHLREARRAFDRLTGRSGTEQMLDTLFGQFCIGK